MTERVFKNFLASFSLQIHASRWIGCAKLPLGATEYLKVCGNLSKVYFCHPGKQLVLDEDISVNEGINIPISPCLRAVM